MKKIFLVTLFSILGKAEAHTGVVCFEKNGNFSITINSKEDLPENVYFGSEEFDVTVEMADYRLYVATEEKLKMNGINTRVEAGVEYYIDLGPLGIVPGNSSIYLKEINYNAIGSNYFTGYYKKADKVTDLNCHQLN